MLLLRPSRPPNERRILTFDLDEKPEDPQAVEAALAAPPPITISDVKLIEGTGPKAVEKIHEKLGTVPVIFIIGTPTLEVSVAFLALDESGP